MYDCIAVGHTPKKMRRLISMIPKSIPTTLMFNGPAGFPNATQTANTYGRDIYMYAQGIRKSNADRFWFVNDDVQHISSEFWSAIKCKEQIIGVGNLSSWIDYDLVSAEVAACHQKPTRGRKLRFIRTSGFICDRKLFNTLYANTSGIAQKFEKATLSCGDYKILNPSTIYDSNIAEMIP